MSHRLRFRVSLVVGHTDTIDSEERQMISSTVNQPRRTAASRAIIGMLLASIALFAVSATAASADPGHRGKAGLHVGVTKPVGGATVVTIDPAVVTSLTSIGIAVAPVVSATSPAAGQLSFPISGGRINYMKVRDGRHLKRNLSGWVDHLGGFTLTKAPVAPAVNSIAVTVSGLRVNLAAGKSGAIGATVAGVRERVKLFAMLAPTVDSLDRSISAVITLTSDGARLLNKAFSVTTFSRGMKIGTVKVTPTF